jgi:RNA ligase-like protein
MSGMDLRTVDLRALNSLTKYPSIPTYHALDPRGGRLLEQTVPFTGPVIATEKVDGTNARIIQVPGGWLLGSREELLYARGDLIGDPAQGIVAALKTVAEALPPVTADEIRVHYLELYGGKVGAAAKQYTGDRSRVGWRLFDAFVLRAPAELLAWPAGQIAAWRDAGGQPFADEPALQASAFELTPRLFTVDASELPTDVAGTSAWLAERLPATRVALDADAGGAAEGIVLRTPDRSVIAKARFQDYARTLRQISETGRSSPRRANR